MNDEFPPDDLFGETLAELDTAKNLVRTSEAELNKAIAASVRRDQSADCLHGLEIANRAMNDSMGRYRRSVEAFNAVCRRPGVAIAEDGSQLVMNH